MKILGFGLIPANPKILGFFRKAFFGKIFFLL
jgi:hypothetical protein